MSPTQRSLAWFRKMNIPVTVVERWNPHAKIRTDLFGMFDLLALIPGDELGAGYILGVQVTSQSHSSERTKKIVAATHFPAWLAAGGRAVVHGWSKKGSKGKRKLWELTATSVTVPLPPPLASDQEAA